MRCSRILSSSKLPPCPHVPQKYSGPSLEEVAKMRAEYVNPAVFRHYKDPLMIVEGKMQYIFDHTGRRYLDLFGGIVTVSVGHSHPRIVEAIKEQSEKLIHATTLYLHPNVCQLSKEIASRLPGGADKWSVYVTSSGSEANDLAMLMARSYTKRSTMISLRNGYHGMSEGTRQLTAVRNWNHATPRGGGYQKVMCPDVYRNVLGGNAPSDRVAALAAQDLAEAIDQEVGKANVAGFIAERIQGVGGTVELAHGYLPKAYEIVRSAGGVTIADEVQCGFGRVGTHYWGFATEGVEPDIVTMAKSIGNGIPLAAVAAKRPIADSLKGVLHFNTYGGNPLSSRVGLEVLRIIEEEGLQKHCGAVGDVFLKGFRELQKKYEIIGDVRGRGLLLGVEFVKDRVTKEPATEECAAFQEELRHDHDIVMGKGGTYGNVFRVKPPMCITEADAKYTLECVDKVLAKHQMNKSKK